MLNWCRQDYPRERNIQLWNSTVGPFEWETHSAKPCKMPFFCIHYFNTFIFFFHIISYIGQGWNSTTIFLNTVHSCMRNEKLRSDKVWIALIQFCWVLTICVRDMMKLVPCLGLRSAGNHAQLAHLILNSEQCLLRVVWKSKPTFDAGTHAKLLVTLKVIQHPYFTFSLACF